MKEIGDIKYHPLIDMSTNESVYVPSFATNRLEQMENHKLYLEERIPGVFRLYSTKNMSGKKFEDKMIHCPSCGNKLTPVSEQKDGKQHALYVCNKCK